MVTYTIAVFDTGKCTGLQPTTYCRYKGKYNVVICINVDTRAMSKQAKYSGSLPEFTTRLN